MAREADAKTVLGSVWLRAEAGETRAPLSREDIVRTAIEMLDRDGLEKLSMRRLAAELGTAATSALYWRVANKNDLLELAVDTVLAERAGRVGRRRLAGPADGAGARGVRSTG